MNILKSRIYPSWKIEKGVWDDESDASVIETLESVLMVYEKHFKAPCLAEYDVIVSSQRSELFKGFYTPITYSKNVIPELPAQYVIRFSHKIFCWAQHIFQLAHEINHVLMHAYPWDSVHLRWVSEVLSEAASFFVLEESVLIWETKNPYVLKFAEGLPFSVQIKNYIQSLLSEIPWPPSKYSSVAEYYQAQKAKYSEDPNCELYSRTRMRNEIIGIELLDLIRSNSLGWKSIVRISDVNLPNSISEEAFFQLWANQCSVPEEREFVTSFSKMLGLYKQ